MTFPATCKGCRVQPIAARNLGRSALYLPYTADAHLNASRTICCYTASSGVAWALSPSHPQQQGSGSLPCAGLHSQRGLLQYGPAEAPDTAQMAAKAELASLRHIPHASALAALSTAVCAAVAAQRDSGGHSPAAGRCALSGGHPREAAAPGGCQGQQPSCALSCAW